MPPSPTRRASSSGGVPKGTWSSEVNATRALSEDDETVAAGLRAFTPTHSFRRDLLAYCTLRNIIPHPKLLPLHPDEEEALGAEDGGSSGNVYDLSDVEQVTIKNWVLDDANCHALCFSLPHATRLRSLSLFNAGLTQEQLTLVCRCISTSHIQSLQLDWNPIVSPLGDVGSDSTQPKEGSDTIFAELLGENSRLVFLSLRANGITACGASAIASALRGNMTLEALNLFDNCIGDDGAIAIAHALPHNTTLRVLSLANNNIARRGFKALTECVTKYQATQELLDMLHAAESRIQAQIDQAKKAKKKLDRAAAIAALGLPVLEHDAENDRWLAPGNATLQELVLSGNTGVDECDVRDASVLLESHREKLLGHLRHIKLQRLALLVTPYDQPPLSDFICV